MANSIDVVYDGDCNFCKKSLDFLKRFTKERMRLFASQDTAQVQKLFPELAGADFQNAMFSVDAKRKVHRGFFAFRSLLWTTPWFYIFIPIFYFPGVPFIGQKAYAWVAKNRRKLGCSSESCSIGERK